MRTHHLLEDRGQMPKNHHGLVHPINPHSLFLYKGQGTEQIGERGVSCRTITEHIIRSNSTVKSAWASHHEGIIECNPADIGRFRAVPIAVNNAVENSLTHSIFGNLPDCAVRKPGGKRNLCIHVLQSLLDLPYLFQQRQVSVGSHSIEDRPGRNVEDSEFK